MDERALLVVGEGPVADALVAMTELLGWTARVATSLDEVHAALPGASAVVVTSHDATLDAPAIGAALAAADTVDGSGPVYVGGMGSRSRQARRREWLLADGVPAEAVDAVHGPAGLDIGADAPAEIALSILAELVAVTRGVVPRGSLCDRSGPVHPDLPPGEAFSPTG